MTTQIQHHQELSDEDVDRASIDDLRAAYRALRDHHIAETTALISRRDDLTRRRDAQLAKNQHVLTESQKLIERADAIMTSDQETLDRLGTENARLSEIIDYMQNRYSPIGGRSCALCVYVEGRFIRPCALHRWEDTTAKVLASRAADPEDPLTTDQLSDGELATWAASVDVHTERRDAELIFAEVDRQFQEVDCRTCDDEGADNCEVHKLLVRQWRSARAALCDLARIHRGYLRSLNAPNGGDP